MRPLAPTAPPLPPGAYTSLFQSINGLRNGRALAAVLIGILAGALIAGVASFLALHLGAWVSLLGGLGVMVATGAGVNGAGMLLLEQARGEPLRELGDALRFGLSCIPRLIGLGLSLLGMALAVVALIAVAYAVCRLPLLGPLLFAAVFPLSILIAGVAGVALLVALFLALPPLWDGATVRAALRQAFSIARGRLVETVLMVAIVWGLTLAVALIVGGVMLGGLMPAVGLSAAILGGGGVGGLFESMRQYAEAGDTGGVGMGGEAYVLAAAFGGGLLWTLLSTLPSLVTLFGLNLVYLRATDDMPQWRAAEPGA